MNPRFVLALSVCASSLTLGSACAHREPVERSTVSTVGNRDVTGNAGDMDNKKMSYVRVNNEDALGHDRASREQQAMTGHLDRGDAPRAAGQDARAAVGTEQQAASTTASCDLNVYFETASAELNQRAREQLSSIAECLKRHEANDALIVGSADPRGSEMDNQKLGQERARVVSHYLRELGVPEQDIRIRSTGESQASNQPASWPADRNAQIRKQQ